MNTQLQVILKRCDFNMDQCENFDTFIIRDICVVLEEKDQIWSDFVEHTEPKFKCPFNRTSIKVTNATVNMSYLDHLPLDGYIWVISGKLFKSIPNVRYKKQLLFCMMSESKITKSNWKDRNKVSKQN